MKKVLYFLIPLVTIIILLYLNDSKPPFIDSQIGGKADLAYNIELLEDKENLEILVTENDYTKNELVYEVYNDEGDFALKKIDKLKALSTFTVLYDENEDIKSLSYEFSLNNKSTLPVLETIIRSTLIDLTDAGYKAVKDYLKIPEDSTNLKYDRRMFITSGKTLSLIYNKETNSFLFLIK